MPRQKRADIRSAARADAGLELPEFDADELETGRQVFERTWHFVLGVPSLEFLPPADRPEIAFAGRSNVGKSSLINALVRQHGLARTSNTPGRTQELNFFRPADIDMYLVDMPGYGYAKAPPARIEAWTALVRDYLRGRTSLKRTFLLIDARHGIKKEDEVMMALLDDAAASYQLVLTKADKLKPQALAATYSAVQAVATRHPAAHPVVHVTSADDGMGIDALRADIARLLGQ